MADRVRAKSFTFLAHFIIYFLTAFFSIQISKVGDGVAVIWLSNAILVALSLNRTIDKQVIALPAGFVGGLLANVLSGTGLATSSILMVFNVIEIAAALLIFHVLQQVLTSELEIKRFAMNLSGVAFGAPLASACLAGLYFSFVSEQSFSYAAFSWWAADSLGFVVLLPLALLLPPRPWRLTPRSFLTVLATLAVICAIPLAIGHFLAYPFVFMGTVLYAFAMTSTPFRTAIVVAGAALTIALSSLFGWFHPSSSAAISAANVQLALAVMLIPAHCISLAIQHLVLDRHKIRESGEYFRRVMEDSAIGMLVVSADGKILQLNKSLCEMLCYSKSELLKLSVTDITHPDDRGVGISKFADISAGAIDNFRFEKRYLKKDGTSFWALLAGSVVRQDGQPPIVISQIENIEDQKQHLATLAELESRWNFALAAARQGIWDADLVKGTTFYAPMWCEMLGYTVEEVGQRGDRWIELMHPDDRLRVTAADTAQHRGEGSFFEAEFRMLHKNGHWVWVLDRGQVIERDASGTPLRMIGTHTDITVQKKAEEDILLLNEKMRLAVQAGRVGMWSWLPSTETLWWDEQMHTLYGTDAMTFDGIVNTWQSKVHPEDLARAKAALADAIARKNDFDIDFRITHASGDIRYIRALARLVKIASSGEEILIGTNWDITEQTKINQELNETNTRLNEFASFASHDLQAPLRHIRMHAEMLEMELGQNIKSSEKELVSVIAQKAAHLQMFVKDLLNLSRAATTMERQAIDLTALTRSAVEGLASEISSSAAVVEFDDLGLVSADRSLVFQVMQNLISNAIKYRSKAVPNIRIATQPTGGMMVVTISDNGLGIDDKYRDYVFGAFKRVPQQHGVQGFGIGLALCKRIVEAHGGQLWLDQSGKDGSVFKFTLPSAVGEAVQRRSAH